MNSDVTWGERQEMPLVVHYWKDLQLQLVHHFCCYDNTHVCKLSLLWSPYGIEQTIIFSSRGVFLSLSFFPRLISAAAHWMSAILRHMAWP